MVQGHQVRSGAQELAGSLEAVLVASARRQLSVGQHFGHNSHIEGSGDWLRDFLDSGMVNVNHLCTRPTVLKFILK